MAAKNNLAEAVVIERTFNAPVARVWKALTDANEMRIWYFDLKEFKPEPVSNLNSRSSMKVSSIIIFAKSPR